MATIQDAIDKARLELPDMSQAVALKAADDVHRRLCARYPELCRETITIALTSGQMEYDLPETVVQVEGGVFDPTDDLPLSVMDETVETIRAGNRAFRTQPPATWKTVPPSMFVSSRLVSSVRKLSVGFSPPPDAGSAAGTMTLYVSTVPVAAVDSATKLLPGLHSSRVYVEGILFYAARAIRPGAAAQYQATFEAELGEAGAIFRTRVEGAKDPSEKNARAK